MQGRPGAHAVSTHFQLQAGVAIEVGTKTWRALGGLFRVRVHHDVNKHVFLQACEALSDNGSGREHGERE